MYSMAIMDTVSKLCIGTQKKLATLLHNNILLSIANFMKHETFQACAML
jgi:hypothetical protein